MSLGKLIHEFPYLYVSIVGYFPVVIFSPAVFSANDHYPAAYRSADFLFPPHARAETAGKFQGFIFIQIEIVAKRKKNRLRTIESTDKFGNRLFTSIHDLLYLYK
jgi:hypothetical protein